MSGSSIDIFSRPLRLKQLHWLALLLAAICLLGAGLGIRGSLMEQVRQRAELSLLSRSDIKTQELHSWLEEQRLLGEQPVNGVLAVRFAQWLRQGGKDPVLQRQLAWQAQRGKRYSGAWLVDAEGLVRLGHVLAPGSVPMLDAQLLHRARTTLQPVLMDLHLDATGRPAMASINPLITGEGKQQQVVGFLIHGIDPYTRLYPLLQLGKSPGLPFDTVLARREGDTIRYLNPMEDALLPLQLAIKDNSGRLLALQDPEKDRQILEGEDYRNAQVLGVVQRIPEMDWILVTKMTLDDVYAPAHKEFRSIALVLGVVLLVISMFLWLALRYGAAQRKLQLIAQDLKRERQEKVFDFFVHYANDIVLLMDETGNILEANDAASKAYGYSRSELVRLNIAQLRAPATLGVLGQQLAAAGAVEGTTFKTEHLRRDGSLFPVEVSSGTFEENGIRYRQSIIRDISQREAVALALAQSEARFRSLIELAMVGLAEMTPERQWLEANPALCEILGYERDVLLQTPWSSLVHPDDREQEAALCRELLAGEREEYKLPLRFVHAQGSVVWGNVAVRAMSDIQRQSISLVLIVHDITSLKHQEEQLRETLEQQIQLNHKLEEAQNQLLQSEKMASIGQLAAGVAHEINNPVGFVSSNLGTLKTYLDDLMAVIDFALQRLGHDQELAALLVERDFNFMREDAPALVAESLEGIVRVKKIVQDLKDFSRVGEVDWQWANLHQGLESTLNIVWNEIKYKAKVDKHYGDLPQVWCLPSQLNQVFMNLLVNAAHAITRQGLITLRSGTSPEGVWIEVEDTGEGIAAADLHKIFDPFFTTKPVGKGTGLGLSLAFSIIHKHGGHIEVESEVGKGSRFRVCLPQVPPTAPPPADATSYLTASEAKS